jgi:hypothetical protein
LSDGVSGEEHNYGESVRRDESVHGKRKLYFVSICFKRRFASCRAMKPRKEVQKIIEIRAGR